MIPFTTGWLVGRTACKHAPMQENLQRGRNLICKAADRIIRNKKAKGPVQRHSLPVLSFWGGDGAFLQHRAIIILNEYSADI